MYAPLSRNATGAESRRDLGGGSVPRGMRESHKIERSERQEGDTE